MYPFPESEVRAFVLRDRYPEELVRQLKRRLWKSLDVTICKAVILPPGSSVDISVRLPKDLGPFEGLHPHMLSSAEISTRSRLAQLGIEVPPSASAEIAKSLRVTQTSDREAEISTINHSTRPIHLPEATRLFRLFAFDHSTYAMGENLKKLVSEGLIKIEGEEGLDWKWGVDLVDSQNPDDICGIEFRLDPDKRLWLKPDPENTPVSIDDNSGTDYRNHLDSLLSPVPPRESALWIGETTARLTLDPSINGILEKETTINRTTILRFGGSQTIVRFGGRQTNSILIDGGATNWKIRTEILGPTTEGRMPNSVLIRFHRSLLQ